MKKTGFTLIEMLVAVLMFSILLSIFANFFLSAIEAQKKSLMSQELIDSISYNLEYMSRSIRMAKKDDGNCIGDENKNYQSIPGGIKFLRHDDVCQSFYLKQDSRLYDKKDDLEELPLTPHYLPVTSFTLNIIDPESGEGQPKVILNLKIEDFEIQTTISQRNLNL